MFCFDLLDVWKWFGRRAWWRQEDQSKTCTVDLKCCSNYCLHYGFVNLCLDTRRPAFHAVAGEVCLLFFLCSLISAGGKCHLGWRQPQIGGTLMKNVNELKLEKWNGFHCHVSFGVVFGLSTIFEILNQNWICITLAFHFIHLWNKNDLKLFCFAPEELHLKVHRPLYFVTLLHSVLSFLSDRLNHLCYSEMLRAISQDGARTKEPNMVWKSKTESEM